jgi:hypothetical protein
VLSFAGSQVCQFNEISFDKDILRLDVSMENPLPMHKIDSPEDLEHIELDFLEGERVLLVFERFVHVHVHKFED